MVLLDRVLDWDADSLQAETGSHRDAGNVLRAGGRLSVVHLIEYGAQAMAIHGGLRAQAHGETPRPGLLAGVRDVEWFVERIDDIERPLRIQVQRLFGNDSGWMYQFEAFAGSQRLAHGRLSVISA